MDYLGRATNIKFTKKLNGTHSLTFQLPNRFYDSEVGDYVENEYVDQLFNEKKVKLKYMDEWYEFYIKNIADTKQFKTYMKTYTCSDSFIDELSRNGYGLTFDEALYNNVEEVGTFAEEILEDSIWYYSPENNWGDFTEYLEEKMYRIPVSQFKNNIVKGYKINYNLPNAEEEIVNQVTGERRPIEISDDLARKNEYFWDQYNGKNKKINPLISDEINIENDGYIYVFQSCLDFCYQTNKEGTVSTEEIQSYNNISYALSPKTVDPNGLIQFMAFPSGTKLNIDENGLIIDKDYHYVMTVKTWNELLEDKSEYFYAFEKLSQKDFSKDFLTSEQAKAIAYRNLIGCWCVYYNDYLNKINDIEIDNGKKISISNRTEINISDEIDQYVTVYNNYCKDGESQTDYPFVNLDGKWADSELEYRVCSVEKTRQIVPQLARNLIENGIHIKSDDGWDVASIPVNIKDTALKINYLECGGEGDNATSEGMIQIIPPSIAEGADSPDYWTVINFGIVGQEYEISGGQIYCLGIEGSLNKDDTIIIADGGIRNGGSYKVNDDGFQISWSELNPKNDDPDTPDTSEEPINLNQMFEIFHFYGRVIYDLLAVTREDTLQNFQNMVIELKNAFGNKTEWTEEVIADFYNRIDPDINVKIVEQAMNAEMMTFLEDKSVEPDEEKAIQKAILNFNDSCMNFLSNYSTQQQIYQEKIKKYKEEHQALTNKIKEVQDSLSKAEAADEEVKIGSISISELNNNKIKELLASYNLSDSAIDNLVNEPSNAETGGGGKITYSFVPNESFYTDFINWCPNNLHRPSGQHILPSGIVIHGNYGGSYVSGAHVIDKEIAVLSIDDYMDGENNFKYDVIKNWVRNTFSNRKFHSEFKTENGILYTDYSLFSLAVRRIDWYYYKVYDYVDFSINDGHGSLDIYCPNQYIKEELTNQLTKLKKELAVLEELNPEKDGDPTIALKRDRDIVTGWLNNKDNDTLHYLYQDKYTIPPSSDPPQPKPEKKRVETETSFILVRFNKNIKNPYFALNLAKNSEERYINRAYFFEAYTKGGDYFSISESSYKYSGRELFSKGLLSRLKNGVQYSEPFKESEMRKKVLFENDIMSGSTYGYKRYFIQQLYTGNKENIVDTFKAKEYLSYDGELIRKYGNVSLRELPYSSAEFTQDDLTVSTKYIDLVNCAYYSPSEEIDKKDCSLGGYCMYQKYGYCPYLFETEKHCRKIRTLKGEKSNRFNLTQEIGKVFEFYPVYYTNHNEIGQVVKKKNEMNQDIVDKKMYFITEKGKENLCGFRYGSNLSNISRNLKSDQIVTKLYVQDVDSSLSKTGLSSIKTAPDNLSKDSFIIDFSYYIQKGILSKEQVERDLYGIDPGDMAYLKKLGALNTLYDKVSNLIIDLTKKSYTELEANVKVNLDGLLTAQQQLEKLKKQQEKYKQSAGSNKTYENYQAKIEEQNAIYCQLLKETFCDEAYNIDYNFEKEYRETSSKEMPTPKFYHIFDYYTIESFRNSHWVVNHDYQQCGMLGQYNTEFNQIQEWKKIQSNYLRQINKLSMEFFKKYEPYLKEGTWSDSNYISDNAYYFGALEVSAQGSIPKVEYNISVLDLYPLEGYEYLDFDIADTTYIEDEGMFGTDEKTGLPRRLKVIISEITYDLDQSKNNSLKIQNYTTQFEDLFQQVSASVQSLSFNENIYKRASNFSANQNLKTDSLQGALDENNVTLIKTEESNLQLNAEGQQGSDINNHSNQYKLNGQGLFFSNNGGQSWNIGVGPSGINADYIKAGTLDAGKIRIVDNNYLYFYWDKEGIIALKNPVAENTGEVNFNDFAAFNKRGLSIVNNGQIRLRCGYEPGDGTKGSYYDEKDVYKNLGFFIYDDKGNVVFRAAASDSDVSARVFLRGEMLCTNAKFKAEQETVHVYTDYYEGSYVSTSYLATQEINNESISNHTIDSILLNIISINDFGLYKNITYKVDDITYGIFSNSVYDSFKNENSQSTIWGIIREGITLPYLPSNINQANAYYIQPEGTEDINAIVADQPGTYKAYKYRISKFVKGENDKPSGSANGEIVKIIYKDNKSYIICSYGDTVSDIVYTKQEGVEYKTKDVLNTYKVNGKMVYKIDSNTMNYYETKLADETTPADNAGVGVFINNTNVAAESSDDVLRVFSSVMIKNNTINNLLTIMNNGEVRLGGLIDGQPTDISKLPEKIRFQNGGADSIGIFGGTITFYKTDGRSKTLTDMLQELETAAQKAAKAEADVAAANAREYTNGKITDLSNSTSMSLEDIRTKIGEIVNTLNQLSTNYANHCHHVANPDQNTGGPQRIS